MKRGDVFQSSRLKAEDIKGHDVTVQIEDIRIEEIGQRDKKEKPCVYFKGKEKSLVLNVTNWNRLEDFLLSDDSDDWIGCRIVLSTERVEFSGRRVDAIRVISGEPKKAQRRGKPEPVEDEPELGGHPKSTQSFVGKVKRDEPVEDEPNESFVADDDDVPF